jgi:hypothetical protein
VGGVGLQARANQDFLSLPLKTSLKGWHTQWFYCENHEPSLPPFIGRLPKYDGSWVEELTEAEAPIIQAVVDRVSELKQLGLMGVDMATNWLPHRVVRLKQQIHPS